MPTRDVWRLRRAGSLDRLSRETEELEAPRSGHARVAVGAVGLNFADLAACLGLYSATPPGAFVPGLEFAGTVEAVGEGAAAVAPGDRVIGLTRFGGYATRVNADARYLHPLPAGWSVAEGAAFPVQAITAWYGISELGACKAGDTVLVQSAAGGVGLNALAILERLGARVVAAVGHHSKVAFLVDHAGLERRQIVVRDRGTFGSQLDEVLRVNRMSGFDLVLDAVAGPFFDPAYRRLRPGGRIVIYGAADLMPSGTRTNWLKLAARYLARPRVDPIQMVSANKSVMGFNLIWLWEQADRLPRAYAGLAPHITRPPHIGRRFAFAEAPAALRYLQSGGSIGKVVLEV
ncbi:MAG: zinc-binding dehydrogenase [Vicinamibacterales bacterium]|nr:zinc-binding dehydrogenase [Vicinamibacterales bacterium]